MEKIAQKNIRNVAIIAHVDHGKTTLVDQLFRQSGLFRENQDVKERLMDSIDLERERGITIKAKNGACHYNDHLINIIDTPGHADFGGEVERVLRMADGALFLVDAQEGPMPQSLFVLRKAIALSLPIVVVVNKIDKPAARCDWVVDQVFDAMVGMNAPDDILDFPVIYCSARDGVATTDLDQKAVSMAPIFDAIITHLPPPAGDPNGPVQLLVSAISYSPFVGRLAIGKLTSGQLKINQEVVMATTENEIGKSRISKLFKFKADQYTDTQEISVGDIAVVAGFDEIKVGQTITDPLHPLPLPSPDIDPPTVSMIFSANDSPFAGKEGKFVTEPQVKERLFRELLTDVALQVDDLNDQKGVKVSGRGELHLSILIEKMRREGYEFQVSCPSVVLKEVNGKKQEPFETLTIDVDDTHSGKIIETLGARKGQLLEMTQDNGQCRIIYKIPTRGLLGYQSEFMSLTKGLGVMAHTFLCYDDFSGAFKARKNGVLVSKETGTTVAFALFNLQNRGRLFLGPGVAIYQGQILGEHSREDDLVVNPCKGKKLTNMRASGSDDAVILTPHKVMSLEDYLSFISHDELVECTPESIRIRKKLLTESARKQAKSL